MLSFKFDRKIGLVTIPSRINQNLSLLDVDEHLIADSLAVIHEGYVNVIPLNATARHAKYVPLQSGSERGSGFMKEVKWLRLKGETLFIILSTVGLQIYDAEVTEMRYSYSCKHIGDDAYTTGACVIQNEFLCVGTSLGTIWVFASNENNTKFNVIDSIDAHNNAITLMGSFDKYMISCTNTETHFWDSKFRNYRKIHTIQNPSLIPTALKVSNGLIFVGYESGEFCVFDFIIRHFRIREIAHKLEVSSIDFSSLKFLILTTSFDSFLKIWNLDQDNSKVTCCYKFSNDVPLYGGAFLNYNCTEFCIVMEGEVNVNVYVEDVYSKSFTAKGPGILKTVLKLNIA